MLKKTILCTTALITAISAAHAQIPDSSFGANSIVTTAFYGSNEWYNSVAVQTDGKVVAGGASKNGSGVNEFALARYNANGTLDNSFNTTGKVTVTATLAEVIKQIVVQPDGKIIAVGTRTISSTEWAMIMMRFLPGGALDNTFGTGGKVVTAIPGTRCGANNVALQADGKIVVAGSQYYDHYILARYLANGTPDNTFGTNGQVISSYDNNATIASEGTGLAIQPDGKILIAGAVFGGTPFAGIARYNANGTIDNTFASLGKFIVTSPNATDPEVWGGEDIKVLADGKILLSIVLSAPGKAHQPCILRLTANGFIDNTFGVGGYAVPAVSGFYEVTNKMAIEADGKIVAAGHVQGSSSTGGDSMVMHRFDANGTPSYSFGDDGRVAVQVTTGGNRGVGFTLQSDGKLLVAGVGGATGTNKAFVVRYRYPGPPPSTGFGNVWNGGASLYPNPVNDQLRIKWPEAWRGTEVYIQLLNAAGQIVMDRFAKVNSEPGVVDVSAMAAGSYYLYISRGNQVLHSQPVIKK